MAGRFAIALIALPLAACVANTRDQELVLDAYNACRPPQANILRKVDSEGRFNLGVDPDSPAGLRIFIECLRPYYAAQALQGIGQPGTDAAAAQRQGYADLDECLRRLVRYRINGNHIRGRLAFIRITALNEDGTFRWDGGQLAGDLLTGCMRQKVAGVPQQASRLSAPPVAVSSIDGVYAGPVCYGPSANNLARCYQATATVRDGTIVGEWHGREGVTVKLGGVVSPSGDVKMEMHAGAEGRERAR